MHKDTLRLVRLLATHELALLWRSKRLLLSTGVGYVFVGLYLVGDVQRATSGVLTVRFIAATLALAVIVPLTIAARSIVGERERGTMEPLLLLPLSPLSVVAGKAAATMVVSLAAFFLVWALSVVAALVLAPYNVPAIANGLTLLTGTVLAPLVMLLFTCIGLRVSVGAPDTATALATAQLMAAPVALVLLGLWSGFLAVPRHGWLAVVGAAVLGLIIAAKVAVASIDPERLVRRRA